jgi:hypothetical protein
MAADFVPNGDALAVVRLVDGWYSVEAPVGKAIYKARQGHSIFACRISPDGSNIAFIESSQAGDHLMIIGFSGEAVRSVGPFEWSNRYLSWSPDGREVVLSGLKRSGGTLTAVAIEGPVREVFRAPVALWIYDIAHDGSTLVDPTSMEFSLSVLDASGSSHDLSWQGMSRLVDLTPSGSVVLFTDRIPGSEGLGSYIRRLDGSPPTLISVDRCFAIAPDGSFVLAIARSNPEEMLLIPTGSGDLRKLGNWSEFRGGRVLPDGRSALVLGSPAESRAGLYRVAMDTGTTTSITASTPVGLGVPSPNSRSVGVAVADGLAVLDLESSAAPKQVPEAIPGEWIVGWSADSRAVLTRRPGVPIGLNRLDLLTGKRSTLWQLVPRDSTGFMGEAGAALAANDGKTVVFEVPRTINSNLWIAEGIRYK